MRRSTDPGADGCPSSGVVRNRYAEEDATAPAAMTPLMKPRRDTDGDVSSGIFLSSIAGSPRRVGIDRMERDLIPATIIRYASQINGLSSLPDVYECLVQGPAAATRLMIPHAPDLPRRRRYRHRFQAPSGGRR